MFLGVMLVFSASVMSMVNVLFLVVFVLLRRLYSP